MSRLIVFVFFLVVAVLSIVASKKFGPCEKPIKRRGWGGGRGACFGTQDTLWPRTECDAIIYNTSISGCPDDKNAPQACCVDCSRQTSRICNRGYKGSIAMNSCCPGFLEVMKGRPGSGCVCCKHCRPKPRCRRHKHHKCITKHDPVYNATWCRDTTIHKNPQIKKRQCRGNGCWCCKWDEE